MQAVKTGFVGGGDKFQPFIELSGQRPVFHALEMVK
jgi:hypothetical protein